MRIIYFILSSSCMIALMLLFRRIFRDKISASAMYALWLIPFFRLLIPFGFIAIPVSGVTAEFIKNPILTKDIVMTVWIAGAVVVAGCVIIQNFKLRKKINAMEWIDQVDGIEVYVSDLMKTPCLFGLKNPKIIVTEKVMADLFLYEFAITHEMEHYHHKDHIINLCRISMCILYWWNPLVWYGAKCVSEDAELACDERVLFDKSPDERKNYGYALLRMIEYAHQKPLYMTTSFSGNNNFMKRRIEDIGTDRITKKYVLFPVMYLLLAAMLLGCMYPNINI